MLFFRSTEKNRKKGKRINKKATQREALCCLEPTSRFELPTSSLPRKRSTPELRRREKRAGDRVRTGDIQLGRLTLYQLSYSRIFIKTNKKSFLKDVGRAGFEPAKVKTNRFTVCPRWPLEYLPNK